MLYSHEKEWPVVTHSVDKFHMRNVEEKMTDTKEYALNNSIDLTFKSWQN